MFNRWYLIFLFIVHLLLFFAVLLDVLNVPL